MSAYTYTELVDQMKVYFEDTDDEFTPRIPDLISQGEARVYGDLELDTGMKDAVLIVSSDDPEVPKPTNCISIQEVRYQGGTQLFERTVAWVRAVNTSATPAWPPRYWAETTFATLEVAPTPSANGALRARYSAPEEQVSTAQESTWLSRTFGDLLLMSCLWAGETFNKNRPGEEARAGIYATYLKQAQSYLSGRARQSARS